MEQSRCIECQCDWDQCSNCYEKDKRQAEHRRNTTICEYSEGKVLEKDCQLKAISAKLDQCSKCNYIYIYP